MTDREFIDSYVRLNATLPLHGDVKAVNFLICPTHGQGRSATQRLPMTLIGTHRAAPRHADREAARARVAWDAGIAGFGGVIGAAVAGEYGAVVGGVTAYLWGRYRWPAG